MNKRDRHRTIREIVAATTVGSQEELRQHLAERGWDVTQSTLSRDLHELRLARVPSADGMRYAATTDAEATERGRVALEALLPQLFARIDGVGELIVLHTLASGAQPISEAIDAMSWKEVLGTIAGENTVLLICRSAQARQEVTLRLTEIAAGR